MALEDPDPEPRGHGAELSPQQLHLDNPNRYREAGARRLRPWLEELVAELAHDSSTTLAVRFVSDREMRRLNREFRGKDKPTDVLTFAGEETEDGIHLGDIAVSVPTARRQALERGHSVERELEVLLLHGILHCLGYDHESDNGEMERLERTLRRQWIEIS
jgi:probable rRNA maturation factor